MTNQVASVASATIFETIGGMSVDAARETLHEIGAQTLSAERAMAQGKQALDVLDANLLDIVKDAPYAEFMQVREFHVAGAVDMLDSVDAAEKRWERQINRLVSNCGFVRPKSTSPDAVRKAKAKEEEIAKLAEFSDDDLAERKAALLSKGDKASLKQALKLDAEISRRGKDENAVQQAVLNQLRDKIIAEIKAIAKAGGDDAEDKLSEILFSLQG